MIWTFNYGVITMSIRVFSLEDEDLPVESKEEETEVEDASDLEELKTDSVSEIDASFESLDKQVHAYGSLSTVYSSLSQEDFSLVDNKNQVLFNEYIKNITSNLGLSQETHLATESIVNTPYELKHHTLALEGFISKIWEGIKNMFKKIGAAMSAFFKKHFTSLGITKKRIENNIKVLEKTEKDIKQINLEKIPGKLTSIFPVSGTVSEGVLERGMKDAGLITKALHVINTEGSKIAKMEVLDRDFVAKVKSLRDQAKSNRDEAKGKSIFNKDARASKREAKQMEKEADSKVKDMESVVKDNQDIDLEAEDGDEAMEKTKRELADFYKKIQEAMSKLVDVPLPGKSIITEVKVDEEEGIVIETEENKNEVDAVSLGSKASLLGVNRECLKLIGEIEKNSSNYTGINNEISKTMDTVDRLINDLSRAEDSMGPNSKKYKAVLEKKVKVRLDLLKNFFKNYNKLNKTLLTHIVSVGDGVVLYTTVSLKYFG